MQLDDGRRPLPVDDSKVRQPDLSRLDLTHA